MKNKEKIGEFELNKIYCMDCLEGLKRIPDNSIDLVFADPPYNAKNIGPNQRVYSQGQMQLPEKDYKKFCQEWFKETFRIGKTILVTPGIANINYYPQSTWIICWHKPAAVSFNRMGGFNAWEPILIYIKEKKKGQRLGQDYVLCNTLNLKKGPEREHPCPKPVELMRKLIKSFSDEEDLVLDPFVGSGTTLLVAKQLGRKFMGFEINPEYVKIANKRLTQEVLI